MEDIGVKLRNYIGVETMLGQRLPACRSDLPAFAAVPHQMLDGVSDADLRKITSENAAKMFRFELN